VLGRLLERIAAGELDAPPGLVAKLEDAKRTLEAVAEPERPRRRRSPNPT